MSGAKAAAADYRREGWCPIPIKEGSKQTALARLAPYLERPATAEELRSWSWSGVGIVTGRLSGVLVLDVDGPEGEAELRRHGHPVTPMVRTAGGGLHLYFRHPEHHVKTGIRVAPGLDVKASGGYVVAPPSVGANGEPYEWIVSPQDAELADPPAWLMALLERERPKGPAGPVGERIPAGGRNKGLASLAGSMRRRGMGEAEILAALRVANEQRCEPPLEDVEVEKIATSVARYEPAGGVIRISTNGHGRAQPPRFNFTDLGNAERFVDAHRGRVLWCPARKAFLVWDGKRFAWDDRGEAVKLAHHTARRIFHEAADAETEDAQKAITKWALASQNESRINAMLSQSKPYLAVGMEDLDRDPWLVNCQNGTLDLRTARLKSHEAADRITKIVPVDYDPDASCPRFMQFLEEALVDEAVIKFVKRYSGYTLTGITRERLLAILYGFGKNGKTTLVELLHEVLGDYARNTDVETLLIKKYQGVGNDVAALKGARFVSAAEVEKDRRLAESKVKQLTGRDTVTARFLFGENFDFKPQFKLWLSTNNKPVIQGTDDAIWDRIRLIPFTQRFEGPKADPKLADKLRTELPGVLAWMVGGCLEWQEHGLEEPKKVTEATQQYREEMDTLAAFLDEECVVDPGYRVLAERLYQRYAMWCDKSGERKDPKKAFVARLEERGFSRRRETAGVNKGRYIWLGIGFRSDDEPPEDGGDGSPSEPQGAEGSPRESRIPLRVSSGTVESGEPSEPENQNLPHENLRDRKAAENGFTRFTRFTPEPTEDQERRIEKLVNRGFSEWAARTEVLAKDHPPGCECEVCL